MKKWILFAALACAAAGAVAENTVKNTDFFAPPGTNEKMNWVCKFPASIARDKEGKLTVSPTEKGGHFVQVIPGGPGPITVRGRVKGELLTEGADHDFGFLLFFRDAQGKWLGHKEIRKVMYQNAKLPQSTKKSDGFVDFQGSATAPVGTAEIGLRFDINGPIRVTLERLEAEVTPTTAKQETANLLKNGDFSTAAADGVPMSWQLHTPPGGKGKITVKTAGGTALCRVPEDLVESQSWLVQAVSSAPQEEYTLRFAVRCKANTPMAEYACDLGVFFLDAQGKWLGYKKIRTFAFRSEQWKGSSHLPGADFVTGVAQFTTPDGTAKVGVRLNFSGAGIEAEWRDIRLEQSEKNVKQTLDLHSRQLPATFPADGVAANDGPIALTADWTNAGAPFIRSATRYSLSLNGLWGYLPIGAAGPWAYVKVPGEARGTSGATALYGNIGKYDYRALSPRFLARTIVLPELAGGNFFLSVEGTQSLALRVFWNGSPIGDLDGNWGGELAIPGNILSPPGEKNNLLLLALPRKGSETTAHLYAAGKPRPFDPPAAWSPGRIYDVTLLARGKTPIFEDVRIVPSWRKKTLAVHFPSSRTTSGLCYHARINDRSGKELHAQKNLKTTRNGERLELTVDWANPLPWTPDTPNLLTLTLSATDAAGTIVDESLPFGFGFREIWREGKTMYINGQELRLRPRMGLAYDPLNDEHFLRRSYSFLKDMGFNAVLRMSAMQSLESSFSGMGPVNMADELGLFYIAYTPYGLVSSGQFFRRETTDVSPELIHYMNDNLVARFHNHPSVIAYSGFGTSAPFGDNVTYANQPDLWGIAPIHSIAKIGALEKNNIIADKFVAGRLAASIRFVEALKKLDPSRLFLSHYDSGAGDGWGIFDYFNWTPMQEWEEWVANYPSHGVVPIGSWEHGNPYPMSFVNHAIPDGDGEPWITEYAAMWLGPKAYELEQPAYLALLRKLYDPKRKVFGASAHHGTSYVNHQPPAQAVWSLFNQRLFRSWRLAGINMGIEPFGPTDNYVHPDVLRAGINSRITDPAENLKTPGIKGDFHRVPGQWLNEGIPGRPTVPTGRKPDGLTLYGETLFANNRPFLGFIAGDKANPMSKTHIFRPGETVEKQIALLHDAFTPLKGRATGSIVLAGRVLQKIDMPFEFHQSGTQKLPLAFTVPESAAWTLATPLAGAIELVFTADDGRELGCDRFDFSVLQPPAAKPEGVVLFDPAGSGAYFTPFASKTVKTPDFSNAETVVFAPGALTDAAFRAVPAGKGVLVLAQAVERLEELGLRAYPVRLREFWGDSGFPVASELLRDWRGGRPLRLGESFSPLRKGYNNTSGTTGMVAESVIEVPGAGNFTPLAHGGFDLAQTPLLAAELDGHPVLFCQLALAENAAQEPAAQALIAALIERLRKTRTAPHAPAVLGDAALLTELGAPDVKPGLPANGAVLATDVADIAALRSFVENGGSAVVLPQSDAFYRAFDIPFQRVKSSRFTADAPGLNAGNFHYRQELDLVLFDGSGLREFTRGKGKLILAGFDPRRIDVEKEPYLALSRKRQIRTLAQLLTNIGMRLGAPARTILARLHRAPVRIDLAQRWEAAKVRATDPAECPFAAPSFDDEKWESFAVEKNLTNRIDAQVRLYFRLTAAEAAETGLLLDAGTFDDFDETYLNGVKLGETSPVNTDPEKAWSIRRRYPVPDGVLKPGDNVLALRVWNRNGPSKGWNGIVRGPFFLLERRENAPVYPWPHRHSDDPYLLHQW